MDEDILTGFQVDAYFLRRSFPAIFALILFFGGRRILKIFWIADLRKWKKCINVEADVYESSLHPREDVFHLPLIDIAYHPLLVRFFNI